MAKPIGQTKDVGWQIGAQRTFRIELKAAWRLVISRTGRAAWLGDAPSLKWEKGETYRLSSGVQGEVRVFKPESHLRISWYPPDWPRSSTIQVRVIPKPSGSVISFHQEHLPGPDEREDRRKHFISVLDALEVISET